MIGIGLSENTGIIVENGYILKIIGSGTVVIVEGHKINYNNLHKIEENSPITLGHIVLHTLSHLDKFNLNTRELKPTAFQEFEIQIL